MSARAGQCPSCGAAIRFRWSSAVQTRCEYCQAILVRHDIDLQQVGRMADLPEDASPIQLGAEGVFGNRAFVVVGRLAYQWDQGGWNEWHLVFNDGTTGWLSDAQAEYAVSFPVALPGPVPGEQEIRRGQEFFWAGVTYRVTTLTQARYTGFDGDLPFRTDSRDESLFADLRTVDGRFATLDYSENPPLLYMGQAVEFDDLRMNGLKEFEGW